MLGTNLELPPCGGLQNDMPRVQLRSEEVSNEVLRLQSGGRGWSPGMIVGSLSNRNGRTRGGKVMWGNSMRWYEGLRCDKGTKQGEARQKYI